MGRFLLLSILFLFWSVETNSQSQCPTIKNDVQLFCESVGTGNNFHKPMISDLVAIDNGGGISWFASETDTEALASDHLLEHGVTYYADNSDGDCGTRSGVLCEISDSPNAGATTQVTFCSDDEPIDLLTVYRPSILGPPDAGGSFSPALASGGTVFDPTVDAAGRYKYTVESTTGCPDDDSYIYITVTTAPDAGENGTASFSLGDEPKDLMEFLEGTPDEGGTWSPALASGTGIFDPAVDSAGEYTYTVAGGMACEDATATVSVTIQSDPVPLPCPTVEEDMQTFCESEGTGNNFHKPMISDLMAVDNGGGISWYASETDTEALASDHLLEDGVTYYADSADGNCGTRSGVLCEISDSPNAGATTQVTFCSDDEPIDLLTVYRPSILGPPDEGGSFSPALASGGTVFDPSVDAAGRYKYTVESTTGCPDDDSYIYITVTTAPDAGENGTASFSLGDEPKDLMGFLEGTPDEGGTWSPVLASGTGIFDPAVDSAGEYTYTVAGGKACVDATATVNVTIQSDPVPLPCPIVEDDLQTFCESEGTGNNFHKPMISNLVAVDNGGGISWYASEEAIEALADDHLLENGLTYYADNASGNCGVRSPVLVNINDSPNAGATTQVTFCSDDEPIDLLTVYRPSILGPPDVGGSFSPALASGGTVFDPSVDAAGRYKYTVESTTGCPDDDSYIYITVTTAPDAGENGFVEFNKNDEPQDLLIYLGGSPETGGYWSPELSSGNGIFDPSVDLAGDYTYTIESGGCESSAIVSISILGNAQDEASMAICHKGQVLHVNQHAIQAHLDHGDSLGECDSFMAVGVYPNPSRGLFNLDTDKTTGKIFRVRIVNTSGRVLNDYSAKQGITEIDLSGLAPGMYLAELYSSQGKTVKRLIKR